MPILASVGTALPPYEFKQEETKEFARRIFNNTFKDLERLLKVFQSAEIEKRYFCKPLSWFEQHHSWEEKNALFIENALCLGTKAITSCLRKVKMLPSDIDIIIFVTSTGIATPSIDAYLYNLLAMKPDVIRIPLWGLGCAGGVSGIARARELALAYPESKILVCCVELAGFSFILNDRSKANLIATSLFADGAGAALIIGDKVKEDSFTVENEENRLPRILDSQSYIWSDSLDVMGWNVQNEGLMVIFSRDIPSLVTHSVKSQVENLIQGHQLTLEDISRYITHPGGMKVLKAYESALNLKPDALTLAKDVLRNHGNMSSGTILYILEKELNKTHNPGEYGIMLALGPGFSCEQVLLQW
jgi:alkylresorcinol/alkylpyrone synthase